MLKAASIAPIYIVLCDGVPTGLNSVSNPFDVQTRIGRPNKDQADVITQPASSLHKFERLMTSERCFDGQIAGGSERSVNAL